MTVTTALGALLFATDQGAAAGLISRVRANSPAVAPARAVAAVAAPVRSVDSPAPPQVPTELPAGDDPYPIVLPKVSAGPASVIESEGVALNFQNVSYGDPADANSYDVYWPTSAALRRGGAVLMIHGGGWAIGRKDMDTPYALAAARAGYVVAVMDYSTFPHLKAWPAAAQEAFAVADSFRSRAHIYGFDPAHLVAAGWSAGGNLAELLGTVGRGTDRVAAVVSWSGISDMTALAATESTVSLSGTLQNLIGCSLAACPQIWRNGSPVTHVGEGDAPMLFFAGSREYVPATQSSALETELQAVGIPTDMQVIDTDAHGGDLRPFTTTALMDWLHRYADTSPAAG